jgi:hypothetical protein
VTGPTLTLLAILTLASCSTSLETDRSVSFPPVNAVDLLNAELGKRELTFVDGLIVLSPAER